jgi:hypothetical protein
VFHHLGQLSPGTIRVYAAAIEHRRSFGEPPSADVVRALAREEGASEGAALVLCRWVVVHDRETLVAIICTDRLPRARVFLADGRPLPNRMLRTYADGWDEAVAQGRTVTEVKS